MDRDAKYFSTLDSGRLRCLLCPVGCKLRDGEEGVCMGRVNRGGKMVATNYGEIVSVAIDPIEKKPLYHFHPGDPILSVGPNGCNLSCKNCQNWTISQEKQPTSYMAPDQLVALALDRGSPGIAYTYSEPFIWYEYLCDVAALAHDNGLYNVCVTNGYINAEPLSDLIPLVDAVNIDVKSIRAAFYRTMCKGNLETVMRTVDTCAAAGMHVEVTNLLIPGLNDTEAELRELAAWIASLDRCIPLHLSRYFPNFQLDVDATPIETLKHAFGIAKEYLDFVYVGNAQIEGASDTLCPGCGATLISRSGFAIRIAELEGKKCRNCGREISIVV
jgi:pyruvate formate lyase activating enzyme